MLSMHGGDDNEFENLFENNEKEKTIAKNTQKDVDYVKLSARSKVAEEILKHQYADGAVEDGRACALFGRG